jgi:hypothetical protein
MCAIIKKIELFFKKKIEIFFKIFFLKFLEIFFLKFLEKKFAQCGWVADGGNLPKTVIGRKM